MFPFELLFTLVTVLTDTTSAPNAPNALTKNNIRVTMHPTKITLFRFARIPSLLTFGC